MPLDQVASSGRQSLGGGGTAPRLVIGSDAGDISPGERKVLAAADIVFCEGNPDRGPLALIAPGTFVELVSPASEEAASRTRAISRARKLAADGWRVVWVGLVDTAASLADFDHSGLADDDPSRGIIAVRAADEPQRLATAFNGLAG